MASADDLVEVTVNVAVTGVPDGVVLLGETLQVASLGVPLQVNCTALVNDPPTEETVSV